MKQAHRMTAQIDQSIISSRDLSRGNIKAVKKGIVDYCNIHSDGSMTGIVRSLNNQTVKYNAKLKVWEY